MSTESQARDRSRSDRGEAPNAAVVADLGTISPGGGPGVVWSLPHGGDLDANLVRLTPASVIGTHVNDDVDVLVFVQSGDGQVVIDDIEHRLRAETLVMIPRGAERSIRAGARGVYYLSIHQRRPPLGIGRSAP